MPDPAEIEMMRQILAQEAMAPQRMPRPGDPGLPPQGMTVARSALSPQVDELAALLRLPPSGGNDWSRVLNAENVDAAQRTLEMGPRAVQAAGQAADQAYQDPSVENVARAGGRAAMVPLMASPLQPPKAALGVAAGSIGLQAADAVRRDLGMDDNAALAAELTRGQQRRMEMERMRAEEERKARAEEIANTSKAKSGEEEATRQGEIAAEAARKERDIYDRAVTRAEERRAVELGRQKQFSDTELGKTWNEWGSAMPYVAGAATGGVMRAAKPAMSPWIPLGVGGLTGAAATNFPLYSDMAIVPPVLNPEREAAEKYAIEAPAGDPKRELMQELAKTLPTANPIRTEAQKQFAEPWGATKRLVGGAAEGVAGAEIGYHGIHALARLRNLFGGGGGGGPQTPIPPMPPIVLPPARPIPPQHPKGAVDADGNKIGGRFQAKP